MILDNARLLEFSARVQTASEVHELLSAYAQEVSEALGYQSCWISVFDLDKRGVRVLFATGQRDFDVWEDVPLIPLEGDPYLQRLVDATSPQVIEDAQTDPDVNRDIGETLGNRTIVNAPMRLLEQPFGALGFGTFGDEGPRPPTPDQLRYLMRMAEPLTVATARIVLFHQDEDAEAERAAIDKRVAQRQRLESLGQLAGGVAHDFNNLLTVVMANASLLKDDETSSERRDELQVIVDAACRAASMTRRLLALGQQQPLWVVPVQIEEELERITEVVRRVLPARIKLSLEVEPDLSPVLADATQIEQVLLNLCLNARDAMELGGDLTVSARPAKIEPKCVATHPWAQPGDYIRIDVTDTGHGMHADVVERIFEPFFTTKEKDKGSGLGLAVCHGIAEQHGGHLSVTSDEGRGTTFELLLPIAHGVAASTAPATPGTSVAPKGTEKILVADDERHVRRAIERVLSAAGYDVTTVEDGQSAVNAAQAETFDLVMLDAIMSVMGGREAYEKIRESTPDVRVLFASGYGAEELRSRLTAESDAVFLAKPFRPEVLLNAIRTQLDRPRP